MTTFGVDYATLYEILCSDQDIDRDVSDVINLVSQYMGESITKKSLLDVGCGTGSHLQRLSRHFNCTGIDVSQHMLRICKQKMPDITTIHADAKSFNLERTFDVIISMSAVLGYQTENQDVADTLANYRKHLKKDGLLIFDVWHGNTVISITPAQRVKQITTDGNTVIRVVNPILKSDVNICQCDYTLYGFKNGALEMRSESHKMRYFFTQELEYYLQVAGFKTLSVREPSRVTSSEKWHMQYAAMAI